MVLPGHPGLSYRIRHLDSIEPLHSRFAPCHPANATSARQQSRDSSCLLQIAYSLNVKKKMGIQTKDLYVPN